MKLDHIFVFIENHETVEATGKNDLQFSVVSRPRSSPNSAAFCSSSQKELYC